MIIDPLDRSAGPHNALIDVAGLRVGHYSKSDDGFLTGTTVILAPEAGMTASVDVRGGGPGTRETDLLNPVAAMESVNAIVLTGGSAYGLAAASGVADRLGEQGIGFRVGPSEEEVVPIVPAAVIFDLGRGGDFRSRPTADFGANAVIAAQTHSVEQMCGMGNIGAGVGAVTGRLKGGVGTASEILADGTTVAALVVVNAVGSAYDPRTGALWGVPLLLSADGPVPALPTADNLAALLSVSGETGHLPSPTADPDRPVVSGPNPVGHTTLAVVATDARLTKAQCQKLAGAAHDGMSRAINPIHTMFDGDVAFAAATGVQAAPSGPAFFGILQAAADVVTRAIVRGMLAAQTVTTSAGTIRSYSEVAGGVETG